MALKQERVHFVFRPKQSMYFRTFFFIQGQGFKPSAAHLHPNFGRVLHYY